MRNSDNFKPVNLSDFRLLDDFKGSLYLGKELENQINNWIKKLKPEKEEDSISEKTVFAIYGEDPFSLEKTASYIANNLAGKVILLTGNSLLNGSSNYDNDDEATLYKALQILDSDEIKREKLLYLVYTMLREFLNEEPIAFIFSKNRIPVVLDTQNVNWIELNLDCPDKELRETIWNEHLKEKLILIREETIKKLYSYRFYEGQIRNAIAIASSYYESSSTKEDDLFEKELVKACEKVSLHHLSDLAVKMESEHELDDLVLSAKTKELFKESIDFIKHRDHAFKVCGIEKSSHGKGVNILFTGKSGTGKTMAASILANELGLPIYKVNLSAIVSKWLGETEKNINRIFDEARKANVVLFFDEADSIFHKRTEAKEGQDHDNNLGVGFLLQKMEEHEGTCILSTNLKNNIDEAFKRRFRYIIPFALPGEKEREAIWRNAYRDFTILSKHIDFEDLSRLFKTAGANIMNIALSSVVLAKTEGSEVTWRHILKAGKRDMEKRGELFIPMHFQGYEDLAFEIAGIKKEEANAVQQ